MAPSRKRQAQTKKNDVKETKHDEPRIKQKRVSHPCYETPECGYVLSLGQGDVGQLGLGEDYLERKKPTPVKGLDGVKVIQVVCGGMHTLALSDSGKVYSWGCNDEGALGRETESKEGSEFIAGEVTLPVSTNVLQLSAGDSHSAALLQDGSVYIWGTYRDANGPMCLQSSMSSKNPIKRYPPEGNPTDRAMKVVSGNDHTVILNEGGDIFTLGSGEQGQLGRVKECFSHRGGRRGAEYILLPHVVRFRNKKLKFRDIFAGSFHTFAVERSGDVYVWGLNNYGQLGIGNTVSHFDPVFSRPLTELAQPPNNTTDCTRELHIAGGQHHSVAVSAKSLVYCVGRSEYGRLGIGDNAKETADLVEVTSLSDKLVKQVACGEACSFAVSDQGLLYAWGLGTCLQLGNGEEEDLTSPALVKGKFLDPEKHEVLAVDAGGQHTAILVKEKVAKIVDS